MNYDQNLRCSFGSREVPAIYVSSTQLICNTPFSDVVNKKMPFAVTFNFQQKTGQDVNYVYYETPQIFALEPGRGPDSGGTVIRLFGQNYNPFIDLPDFYERNKARCRFDGSDEGFGVVLSSTYIQCTVPPARGKEKRIPEISLNGQDWEKNPDVAFYYYHPPFITNVDPDNISPLGGTECNVTGTNFVNTGTVNCKFADVVTKGKYISDTEVKCYSPPIEKPGKVPLRVSFLDDEYSDPFPLNCFDTPVLESIEPKTGPEEGFTQLKCKGKKFPVGSSNSIKCLFNKTILTDATVMDGETLYCHTPSVLNKNGINEKSVKEYPVDLTMDNGRTPSKVTQKFQYYKKHTIESIQPHIGPIEGKTKVKIGGKDFSNLPNNKIAVRFGTYDAKILKVEPNAITVEAPEAKITGPVYVQVSFNGQQFDETNHNEKNQYIYHKYPIVSSIETPLGPTKSQNDMVLHGANFAKAYDTPQDAKDQLTPKDYDTIYYRFREPNTNQIVGEVGETKPLDNQVLVLRSPKVDKPKNIEFELSYNNQDFKKYDGLKYEFYELPSIKKISPQYAPLKGAEEQKLKVTLDKYLAQTEADKNFDCKYKSTTAEFIVPGKYTESNTVTCDIPKVRNPEAYTVEISPKGKDTYTNNGHTFTFYDPFVLRVEPQIISAKGNTPLDIYGYGFANTTDLKVLFGAQNEEEGLGINCNGRQCTQDATFIDSQHLRTVSKPRRQIKVNSTGEDLQNEKFPVEVSVYGDDFTHNGVPIFYFDEPEIITDLDNLADENIFTPEEIEKIKPALIKSIPANTETFIPIPMDSSKIKNSYDQIKQFFNFTCKYQMVETGAESIQHGVLASFPYDSGKNNLFLCETPNWEETGKSRIYVSLNGKDFTPGFYQIEFTDPLKIYQMQPLCGPIEGHSEVEFLGTGFRDEDNFYFKWGPQTVVPMKDKFLFQDANEAEKNALGFSNSKIPLKKMKVYSPPALVENNTTGGPSTISIDKVNMLPLNDLLKDYNLNSFKNQKFEYFYYPQVYVETYSPNLADAAEPSPITVVGAFFQDKPEYKVKPICKFGDIEVEGTLKSNVRMTCLTPEYPVPNAVVPLTVSLNGKDFVKTDKDFTFFSMIKDAKFGTINPKSGPSTGGTRVTIPSGSLNTMPAGTPLTCRFDAYDDQDLKKDSPGFIEEGVDGTNQIICNTPGGWTKPTKTRVLINLGGSFVRTGSDFFFHKIDEITPCAGPNIGGGKVRLNGGGVLKPNETQLTFDGETFDAQGATGDDIEFPLPRSKRGKYVGPVDLGVSMQGEDKIDLKDGFYYYEQPTVTSFYPTSGPAKGKGKISVTGKNFREDFKGAVPSCKIGNYYGEGKVINNDEMVCTFKQLPAVRTKPGEKVENATGYDFSISLNNDSFVPPQNGEKFKGYSVNYVQPASGPISGGTLITVHGYGFTKSDNIRCRFGTSGWFSITEATYIDSNTITCFSPTDFTIPKEGQLPFSVPFSVAFSEDEFDPWTETSHFFTFYESPKLIRNEPKEGKASETKAIDVDTEDTETYSEPVCLIKEENYDVIGDDKSHKKGERIEYQPIKCKFGRFGTTEGTYINKTRVICYTPPIKNPDDIGYEKVDIEVALNGQDFIKGSDVTYTFIGEGAGKMIWVYILMILFIAILAVLLVALASSFWNRIGVSPKEGEGSQVRNKKIKYLITENMIPEENL